MNVLFLDTEVAPLIVASWGIHDQKILSKDIIQDWFFVSGQWSWNDQKKVNTVSLLDDGKRFNKNHRDDYHVVKTLHEVIDTADILVGHNVKNYDLKRLYAKFLEHKLKPPSPVQVVDTLTWSKKFGFTSRKLGDLCKKLELENKLSHAPNVFLKAAMGDKDAVKQIVKYGKGDIPTLRQLYYVLKPYSNHPNTNLYGATEGCPSCGSLHFQARGFTYTAATKRQRFQCQDCGKFFSSRESIKNTKYR